MYRRLVVTLLFFLLFILSSFAQDASPYTLQIIHSSDNESSFQDPNTLEPKILNYATIVDGLQQLAPNGGINTIHVTVGDHTLVSPFYEASAELEQFGAGGLADIAMFNAMDVTANGIGNQEFSGGINDFARMLATANYPFLSVNLDFSNVELADGVPPIEIGEDATNIEDNIGKVVKSVWVNIAGEPIGLIGRAPSDFFNVIDNPENNVPGLDFVGGRNPDDNQPLVSAVDMVNEQVRLLEEQGINKIILLDHAQDFTSDPLSAQFLRGVDIIVSAGSTGFMAQTDTIGPFNFLRAGDSPQADYPTVRIDSENNFILVVNNAPFYRYVGHLLVTFDADGVLSDIDQRSGPIATTQEALDLLAEIVPEPLTVPTEVQAIYDALSQTEIIQEQFEVIGTTITELNGERELIRSSETNLARLITDSTLWWANRMREDGVDVALKNSGGIRASILGPNITRFAMNSALAFNNNMVIIELTGAEMIATFENSISRYPASDGRFPQIAGAYLEFDASRPSLSDQISVETPSRIKTLIITRADGTEDVLVDNYEAQGDLTRQFTIVTNGFLSSGGDGYQSLLSASETRGILDPNTQERDILIGYINEALGGVVDLPNVLDNPRIILVE